ncbi:hypothetical protein KC316_g14637, partial [Hortaea werneckii]
MTTVSSDADTDAAAAAGWSLDPIQPEGKMAQGAPANAGNNAFKDKEKPQAVRTANITAARAVADAIRTSLGPRGMDKMIQTGKGETIIT